MMTQLSQLILSAQKFASRKIWDIEQCQSCASMSPKASANRGWRWAQWVLHVRIIWTITCESSSTKMEAIVMLLAKWKPRVRPLNSARTTEAEPKLQWNPLMNSPWQFQISPPHATKPFRKEPSVLSLKTPGGGGLHWMETSKLASRLLIFL